MTDQQPAATTRPWTLEAETPFVRISDLSRHFGEFAAVDDVTLDIYRGEIFCLLGGSGCGKSTLLRMLAGFEQPTSGRIEIDGQDMAGLAPYDRPTNMMFQSYALFPHMSVEKNVAYGLRRDGMGRAEAMDRTRDMLALVQLSDLARRKPGQLSGGQRQRVALARSLVKQPKLLLLDEPLGALDRKLREETQFELIRIQETLGVTFIIVTHDQEEAMTLSTRIGVMDAGRIVQVGEPSQIYETPVSRFVADFIGSVNIFEGRAVDVRAGGARMHSTEAAGDIHMAQAGSCSVGQTLWFAIRPEMIQISRERPEGSLNALRAEVEEVAYRGNLSIYRLRLEGGKLLRATRANLAAGGGDGITWDEHVWVSWDNAAGVVLTS